MMAKLGSILGRFGLILFTYLLACWLSLVLGVGLGMVHDHQYEIDEVEDKRMQALYRSSAAEMAEPFRIKGDSIHQLLLVAARESNDEALAEKREAKNRIYFDKSPIRRYGEHLVFGLGSSLIGYSQMFGSSSMEVQGDVLMREYITMRPKRTGIGDVLEWPNGVMLLAETMGKYLISIVACIAVVALTLRLRSPLVSIGCGILAGFALETLRNTGYLIELQFLKTDSAYGVGITMAPTIHLLSMYLPIAAVSSKVWQNRDSPQDVASN